MQITLAEAASLMEDVEDMTIDKLLAQGFEIAGSAQVVAAEATPEVETVNAELTAAVELLWEKGTNRAQTKGRPARLKRTLGVGDGIEPYKVIITRAKS